MAQLFRWKCIFLELLRNSVGILFREKYCSNLTFCCFVFPEIPAKIAWNSNGMGVEPFFRGNIKCKMSRN